MSIKEEDKSSKHRKIFYNLETIGENVRFNKKKNYNLNVEGTKNNKVFILAKFKDMLKVNKLSFVTETGHLIDIENYDINKKGYIFVAAIQNEPMLRNDPTTLSRDNILLAKKYLRNQTQSSKKDYHFGTTDHIYGFGFGPVYASNNETKYTIDCFAKSKCISIHFLFI